jgi:hypothetical protein
MQDLLTNTPCKVVLEDFDFKRDLHLRLVLEKLSIIEMAVLEEILYSPLKVCVEELCNNTDVSSSDIAEILEALSPLNLFVLEDKFLLVNKEMRKYFEILIEKFTESFKPNLDYFKELLKLVPIHCLVSWFHTPRTSNNIFESILEKHFKTPKTYSRYLKDTLADDTLLGNLVSFVTDSPEGIKDASEILEHFSLTEEELEGKILFLEYHFILASTYTPHKGGFKKRLSEFTEWSDHKTASPGDAIKSCHIREEEVQSLATEEFSFIKDMSLMLETCARKSLKIAYNQKEELFFLEEALEGDLGFTKNEPYYLARVINKNLLLGLIVIHNDVLRQTAPAVKWLATPLKQRTLITFKHPHNSLSHKCDFSFRRHDRNIIEVQKALSRIENGSWILFDAFMEDHLYRTNSLKQPELVKSGRIWKYSSPDYDLEEIAFIKVVILDWLFESGMIIPGTYKGKDCFKVTSLGHELYN